MPQRSPYFQKKVAHYFRKNEGTQYGYQQQLGYGSESSSFNMIRGAPRFANTRLGKQYNQGRPIYRTRATISRSRFEAALVYKPRILSLKSEEFPFLVHKLSVI